MVLRALTLAFFLLGGILRLSPSLAQEGPFRSALQSAAEAYAYATEDAAKRKKLKITEQLRAEGAEYDLISAIYVDDLAQVRKILKEDATLAHKHRPEAPLRVAARFGRLEVCKELLKDPKLDVNDLKQGSDLLAYQYPIIQEALAYPEVVRLLIDKGADFKSRFFWRGQLAGYPIVHDKAPLLHYAALHGVPETIKLLMDRGADPFVEAKGRWSDSEMSYTPLDVAAIFTCVDNLLAIVNHSKFRDASPKLRQPPLDRSIVNGGRTFDNEPVEIAKLFSGLLEAGANANAKFRNHTALQMIVCDLYSPESEDESNKAINGSIRKGAKVLLDAGAKIDVFSAAALGDEIALRELLKKSPKDASTIGPEGVPAIHMAVKMNYPKIVQLLLAAGCDVNLRNQSENTGGRGTTPVDWAEFWGSDEILELLKKAKGLSSSELENKSNQPTGSEKEQPPKN